MNNYCSTDSLLVVTQVLAPAVSKYLAGLLFIAHVSRAQQN